jgi:integration host factor subunit alpha
MALTNNGIVEQIQTGLGFPKNKSVDPTESVLELIKSPLESGDDGLVHGVGKFCVKERENPAFYGGGWFRTTG